jgi:NADH:ubiquinone oxidoreductase subunit F (NADH-binding)/(2Fe-2S) ferredoxin/ferredoxin
MNIHTMQDLAALSLSNRGALYYPETVKVNIGLASCGIASGAQASYEAASQGFANRDDVQISQTACLGFCEQEPLVEIRSHNKLPLVYKRLTHDKVVEAINGYLQNNINPKWALGQIRDPRSILEEEPLPIAEPFPEIPYLEDIPFYRQQIKIALRNCGFIDPDKIEDYISRNGYKAFLRCLFDLKPKQIIETIKTSGLRGRGGGGFPTGVKWETCANHKGPRYIICNADEGDPGAYMDRSILEGDPHSVLEGMLIAALAIGSNEGFIYVRHEYPLAVKRLKVAIKEAEKYGLLGKNIAQSGFDFTIKISTGAGAFVCGESTALMNSLEGKVGRPRAKYVHTVEKGFRGKPSNLNNVETFAVTPAILLKGADWHSAIGSEKSKGSKVFSLVGKVKNTGLVETPMGISLREIVFSIGGGVRDNKRFKAVQTGGPSGGCIPESLLDIPVDYQKLAEVGSIMGSGGMIVMDQNTCMVDVARYFLDFLKDESCGQCSPCREGVKQMLNILTRVCQGQGNECDVELLQELAWMVKLYSLCGLGTSAPNPVLTTLKYFADEYEAHIKHKKCPAGVCKGLFYYEIDPTLCTGCHACAVQCPQQAISGEKKKPHFLNQETCVACGICYETCTLHAIVVK